MSDIKFKVSITEGTNIVDGDQPSFEDFRKTLENKSKKASFDFDGKTLNFYMGQKVKMHVQGKAYQAFVSHDADVFGTKGIYLMALNPKGATSTVFVTPQMVDSVSSSEFKLKS